jgi:glycosyltransferase involved in cell wall biosynthesis
MGGSEVKIHILTVARYPLGGIRTYLRYTYGQFDRSKFRFTVAAVRYPGSSLTREDLPGFEVDLLETDEASGIWGLLHSTRQALRRSPVDLIHSQGLSAGLVAILADWRWRHPHAITAHEPLRREQFSGVWGRCRQRLMAALLSRADFILCVTEDASLNFREFFPGLPPEKLMVVPNGIDTRPFAETAARRRDSLASSRPNQSHFRFGFLGRFMPEKGFDTLIGAVAELARDGGTPASLRVLAVGRGDCIGRYKAEIHRQGLEAFFEFPGFQCSVADLLGEMDCVVIPSKWEAGPLVPMEAMVAGCPLIASDCPGLREVVRGTPALIARAGDPSSLAQQMKTAMDHAAELRGEFGDFASVAGDRFDVRRTAAAMEQIFSRLREARNLRPAMEVAATRNVRIG